MKYWASQAVLSDAKERAQKLLSSTDVIGFNFIGAKDSAVNLWNADGLYYDYYPKGSTNIGDPVVRVTYRAERITDESKWINGPAFRPEIKYSPNAGYEVYRSTLAASS
jgi:hypothetical protein